MLKKILMRLLSCWIGTASVLLGFLFRIMSKDYYGTGADSIGMPVVGLMLIFLGIVLIIMALAGAFDKDDDSKLKPSEANTSITFDNKQKIQPVNYQEDNCLICITRPSKTMGSVNIFDVYVDDKKVFELRNGQACKIASSPGFHKIRIQVQGWSWWSDSFSFYSVSGETIYVSCISRFNRGPLIERVSDKKK